MSTKIFWTLGFVLTASAAHAELGAMSLTTATTTPSFTTQASPPLGRDPFVELQNLYSAAPAAQAADVTGWKTGRCFKADAHQKPMAQLLAGVSYSRGSDKGPLFPGDQVKKIISITCTWDCPVNYFDRMDAARRGDVQRAIHYAFTSVSDMENIDGSLSSTNDPGNLRFQVRKSGPYLVMMAVVNTDAAYGKAGDVFAACYFFRQVKP